MNEASLADYAEKNDVKKLLALLETNQDINKYDYDKTALHSACVSNAVDAAKILIEKGINVNLQDRITQAIPLHYCAVYNHFDMANLILNNGGNLDISDRHGNQPIWTAVFNVKGHIEKLPIVELFLKHGADKNHKNDAGRSPLDFAKQVKYAPLLELLNRY
jgi:uncharacterized protein